MDLIESEIKRLREKAAEYQEAAKRLLRAADGMEQGDNGQSAGGDADHNSTRVHLRPTVKAGSRKEELVRFLTAHPGSKRAEILSGTKIPVGTISFLLKGQQSGFEKRGKKWFVKE